MWVASYGVMPQAYSVATGPAAAASSPLAVSVILVTGPRPGRSGTLGPRQESIKISATGLPPSGGSGVSPPAGVPPRPARGDHVRPASSYRGPARLSPTRT